MTDHFTDRSRTISKQRCPRQRWLEYHSGAEGRGIVPVRQSVALTVGSCFHAGAAFMLDHFIEHTIAESQMRSIEDIAVQMALAEFNAQAIAGLDVEMGEALPRLEAQAFGLPQSAEPEFAALYQEVRQGQGGGAMFDAYLRAEQACLLEGLVRAWARRGLPRLLEEYEVLEVEREGRWVMAEWNTSFTRNPRDGEDHRLWFLSRPDALLRHRQSGDLVLQSFKTTGAMDARKLRDAQRDMQGLSEGIEVEQRRGERVSVIRYEYLLKGERDKRSRVAKALSEVVGFEARVQQSALCYLWASPGMTFADAEFAHSFSWTDAESGKERKLAWQKWQQVPVWEQVGGVQAWIDLLDGGQVQSEAGKDVLGEILPPPVLVYRQDDDLRDMVEQLEAQEVGVTRDVALVQAADGEDSRRSLLNQKFPQTRTACSYPGECAFVPICYGGADIRRDPTGSGRYKVREPNHPQELVQIGQEATE